MTSRKINIEVLEEIYRRYNRRELVHPDPLEFLYNYDSLKDREVVGLIASSLAYGRVAQILKSVSLVLDKMGDSPYNFITTTGSREIAKIFAGFKHRFTTDSDLSYLLIGIKETLRQHGSLNKLFLAGYDKDDLTILPALSNFVSTLRKNAKIPSSYLIPSPQQGSACKRLNLFLRWMIRSDEVDPGGWRGIPAAKLLVPWDLPGESRQISRQLRRFPKHLQIYAPKTPLSTILH
jgi:uncharacterized protein (TIGR02757 family)